MSRQTPPATWNDRESCDQQYKMWFELRGLEGKEREISIEAFWRGWKAGASTNTISMWKWLDRTVFGHETPNENEKYLHEIVMSEDQLRILEQIESLAAMLAGAGAAIATGADPDKVLRKACKEGAKQLRDIEKSMEKG